MDEKLIHIPKKIHYCWLSDDPLPENIQKCIESWKRVMPDYEIIRWDTKKFDVQSVPFVYEAYQERKWAFAADYIRLYALYHEGGVYLDSDVIVNRNLSELIETQLQFLSGIEIVNPKVWAEKDRAFYEQLGLYLPNQRVNLVQAAILISKKHHPFVKDCLNFYQNIPKKFIKRVMGELIAPDVYAAYASNYGYEYQDKKQYLSNGMVFYPSIIFPNGVEVDWYEWRETVYAVHYCMGSWMKTGSVSNLKFFLKKSNLVRKLFNKKIYKDIDELL